MNELESGMKLLQYCNNGIAGDKNVPALAF